MSKTFKAVLLSALVYPGTGHLYLKKYGFGITIICAFTLPLYFVFQEIMTKAEHVLDKINRGEIPLNIEAISQSLTSVTTGPDAQTLNMNVYLILLIWFIGIIDVYRISRNLDKSQ